MMNICIFEDDGYRNLLPLTYMRAVFELRCGATLLLEKVSRKFPEAKIRFITRDYLAPKVQERIPESEVDSNLQPADDTLFVNGRWLYAGEDIKTEEFVGMHDDDLVYAFLKKETINKNYDRNIDVFLSNIKNNLKSTQIDAKMIIYPWNLVQLNPEALIDDFNSLARKGIQGSFSDQAAVIGDKGSLYLAKGAKVHPFAAIDTSHAPVMIDEGAIVYPFSYIEGPAYIGKDTYIVGGKIREGTSLGPVCRVGGEVEESIIQGYTNKWHDGFLGHSYVCEWVNIGDQATNSDLKNNYSNIRVRINGVAIDTNDWKVGSFVGDHSKFGIGNLLNTGSVVGVCTNIFGTKNQMPPKFVPSFCWGSGIDFDEYRMAPALQTAKKVLSRRGVEQNEIDIALLKKVFELTNTERHIFLKK
ncbi:hypothetical protein GF337_05530 [candidate division KSB1 bacterium]|nr:hypothetical protein [candidate division KSB1 bacterium]